MVGPGSPQEYRMSFFCFVRSLLASPIRSPFGLPRDGQHTPPIRSLRPLRSPMCSPCGQPSVANAWFRAYGSRPYCSMSKSLLPCHDYRSVPHLRRLLMHNQGGRPMAYAKSYYLSLGPNPLPPSPGKGHGVRKVVISSFCPIPLAPFPREGGMICCTVYPGLRLSGLPRATNLAPRWGARGISLLLFLTLRTP